MIHLTRLLFLSLSFSMLAFSTAAAQAQEAPIGVWHGALDVPGLQLNIQVDFAPSGDSATISIPQQGANEVPLQNVRYDAPSVHFELPAGPGLAVFDGTLKTADSTRITGDFTQGSVAGTFHLVPGPLQATVERPQEPDPPYPYESEDLTFAGGTDDAKLAGTLTKPAGNGPFPAVVLISGSGPQDRNSQVFGHKPFLVWADYLTQRGIAVLRYDERGIGESSGGFERATSEDFAGDARAAVRYLAERDDIGEIGVMGHSEGGIVAPMVANQSDDVDFAVLIGAPGMSGAELLPLQSRRIQEAHGIPAETIEDEQANQKRLLEAVGQSADSSEVAQRVRALLDEQNADHVDQQIQQYTSPWFRYFVRHDPLPALRQMNVSVLAITGENDLQVPPDENLAAIRSALQAGDHPDFTVRELAGLNHMLQPSETGLPSEYAQIEQTIAPEALELVGDWIAERAE